MSKGPGDLFVIIQKQFASYILLFLLDYYFWSGTKYTT